MNSYHEAREAREQQNFPSASVLHVCHACGTKLVQGAKFCHGCGARQ
jgi:hypothetical protein